MITLRALPRSKCQRGGRNGRPSRHDHGHPAKGRGLLAAEPGEGLVEDRLAVGLVAPLADVGQVGLVGLGLRRGGRLVLVTAGREPAPRAVPGLGDRPPPRRTTAASRARWRTRRPSAAAERPRRARPHPSGRHLHGCRGSRCRLPRLLLAYVAVGRQSRRAAGVGWSA